VFAFCMGKQSDSVFGHCDLARPGSLLTRGSGHVGSRLKEASPVHGGIRRRAQSVQKGSHQVTAAISASQVCAEIRGPEAKPQCVPDFQNKQLRGQRSHSHGPSPRLGCCGGFRSSDTGTAYHGGGEMGRTRSSCAYILDKRLVPSACKLVFARAADPPCALARRKLVFLPM